jgi:hypothetical protein
MTPQEQAQSPDPNALQTNAVILISIYIPLGGVCIIALIIYALIKRKQPSSSRVGYDSIKDGVTYGPIH